jgi:hypothetical protein
MATKTHAATIPGKHDQYFTELKIKYLRGLVSTVTSSVCTAGKELPSANNKLYCDLALELITDSGTTIYIPGYTKGN